MPPRWKRAFRRKELRWTFGGYIAGENWVLEFGFRLCPPEEDFNSSIHEFSLPSSDTKLGAGDLRKRNRSPLR